MVSVSPLVIYSQSVNDLISKNVANMLIDNLGLRGERYFPLMLVLFSLLLFSNLLGLIPYAYTITTSISFTLFISVAISFSCIIIGLVRHGVQFFSSFIPEGTPLALIPLLVIIETISYIARPFSLGIRLCANIVAGHSLLVIISGFVYAIFVSGFFLSPGSVVIVYVLFLMELGVAILQAFVFTLLTCIYLSHSVRLH